VDDEQCPVIYTVSLKREKKKKSTVYRLSYRMAACPNEPKKKKKKKGRRTAIWAKKEMNKKKKVGLVGDIFNLKKTKVFFYSSAIAAQPTLCSFSFLIFF
jgi:hypothetical protein